MSRLTIVPTPVGNMEDITQRALNTLRTSAFVMAEDTRTSSILFKHYDIRTPLISYHKFNEHGVVDRYVDRIEAEGNAALISDAGTPAISDPGYLLVARCIERGVEVQCLPGATACIPAIVDSGLPCNRFAFEGFLPQKKGRQTAIEQLRHESRTMIFYESPYRLTKTLLQFAEVFGAERRASVSREISKIHEETMRGTLSELATHYTANAPKGEIVIVVEGENVKRKDRQNEETEENNEP